MFVAYFDEVKAKLDHDRKHYYVGGVAVKDFEIPVIEEKLSNLSEKVFGTRDLIQEAEFHCSHIYFAKGPFKGMPVQDRLAIFSNLAQVLAEHPDIRKVYAAIDVTRIHNPNYAAEYAFAHFVERLQLATPKGETCLMIGDLDDEQCRNMVRDFSKFRQNGTPWAHGIEISRIVDSVHFCRSHHSRLLQLADFYMFVVSGYLGGRKGWFHERFKEAVKGPQFWPTRYKIWPNT